jgi:hypothetical protein
MPASGGYGQRLRPDGGLAVSQHTSAYVSIRQHTSAYVSVYIRYNLYMTRWRALAALAREHGREPLCPKLTPDCCCLRLFEGLHYLQCGSRMSHGTLGG